MKERIKVYNQEALQKLVYGNERYLTAAAGLGDVSERIRQQTARTGQEPYAIVITCSDSRVIPESIFSAGIGELFVIRVAGNVLDNHQLGSIEYAAAHLDVKMIILLGHTGCGAIESAIHGESDGFIKYILDDIKEAIGTETDDYKACVMNVRHGVETIRREFRDHPEIPSEHLDIVGAVYHLDTGEVDWIE